MISELSLAEAAVAHASQPRHQPTAKQPSVSNPFGQERGDFFSGFADSSSSSPSPFGPSADNFFGAAELFPPAPKAPAGGDASSGVAPFTSPPKPKEHEGNFFDVAVAGDLDLTETKESFGQFPAAGSASSTFDTTFDFKTAPPVQQQTFGVVEVQVGCLSSLGCIVSRA